jgi:hypothetical protein
VIIFCFLGPETLSCQRVNSPIINCQIFRNNVFGLVKEEISCLRNLKNARVDEKIKETVEADDSGPVIEYKKIYGIVLESQEGKENVFQGYGYIRQPKQKLVEEIQEFLKDSERSSLTLHQNRFWQPQPILTLALMIIPIAFILKTEFFSSSK